MSLKSAGESKKLTGMWALVLSLLFFTLWILISIQSLWMGRLINIFGFVTNMGTSNVAFIRVGSFSFPIYYSMMIVGMIGMSILCTARRKIVGIKVWQSLLTGVLLAVFGFIGAKILYSIESIKDIIENGFSFGGVSFYGTVFFMPIAIRLMALMFKKESKAFIDFCTPAGLLMLACIRVGCYMEGCCHGITIVVNGLRWMIPVQLIEASLDFLLLFIILRMAAKGILKNYLYVVFMGGYGFIRFALEFIRVNPKMFLGMTEAQLFSLVCITNLVLLLIFKDKVEAKRKAAS